MDWKAHWDRHARATADADGLRQVQRTENRVPISPGQLEATAARVLELVEPEAHHRVLDLCCGNGLFAARLAPRVRWLVAVDFCEPLLRQVPGLLEGRGVALVADARRVAFRPASFDRVLLAAAVQHFAPAELLGLLRRCRGWLRPGGRLVATDVPDQGRRWDFFDDPAREAAYFGSVEEGRPLLGSWYAAGWLERAARFAGFAAAEALRQPAALPYARYRLDLRCTA